MKLVIKFVGFFVGAALAVTAVVLGSPAQPAAATSQPVIQTLSLNCGAGMVKGSPAASCGWSQSTSTAFYGYRLLRWTDNSTVSTTIFATNQRTVTGAGDRTLLKGHYYHYVVVAYDKTGNVSGYSKPSTVFIPTTAK